MISYKFKISKYYTVQKEYFNNFRVYMCSASYIFNLMHTTPLNDTLSLNATTHFYKCRYTIFGF